MTNRSTATIARYMAMPVTAARMIAAQVTSKRSAPALATMTWPRTLLVPPKYSPTIAPIRLRVVPTLRAVKKYGKAFGILTRRRTDDSDAAYERISSRAAGSTWVSPRVTLTRTGKKTRTATIIIFDSGLSTPNQLFMSGAKAMIGTALAPIARGSSSSRAVTKRAVRSATTTPAVVPMASPPNASMRVAVADVWSGQRPAPQFAPSASTI
jgi:hypothetical protein